MNHLQVILNAWCVANDLPIEPIGKIVWDDREGDILTEDQRMFARSLMNVWQFAEDEMESVSVYTDLHCFDQIQDWLDDHGVLYDREGGFNVLLTFPNQFILNEFIVEIEADPEQIIPAD